MREKVQELQILVDASQYPSVEEQGFWRWETVVMFDNLYYKIRVAEDSLVGIDTHLDPHGWEIQIFPRGKGDPLKLRALLRSLKISFEEEERGSQKRFIHPAHFAYDEDLEQIRPVLQEIIDKLATSQEREE